LGFGFWVLVFCFWVIGKNPKTPIPNPQSPYYSFKLINSLLLIK